MDEVEWAWRRGLALWQRAALLFRYLPHEVMSTRCGKWDGSFGGGKQTGHVGDWSDGEPEQRL